jgi:hypothetical protein
MLARSIDLLVYALCWLPSDMPPLADAYRFGTVDQTKYACQINREYRSHLERQMAVNLHLEQQYSRMLQELDLRHNVWENLYWALWQWCSPGYRRERLANIRDIIGDDAYYAGQMPEPIPLHWLQRID